MLSHTKKIFNDEKISKIRYQIKRGRGVVFSFKMACLILIRQFNGGEGGAH